MPAKNQKEYQRLWMARRRAEFFKDKVCAICGATEKLELHHIDPTTKVTHHVWSWTEVRRNVELEKCQVLCEKCHATKTKEQRYVPITHGTKNGYSRDCRCAACHQALLDWWRKHRLEKKRQILL